MAGNDPNKGGILRGLKRILFTDEPSEDHQPSTTVPTFPPVPTPPVAPLTPAPEVTRMQPSATAQPGDYKLKVYQLLESLNQPGVDFFEVWNASVEMGGANPTNIKAAYTSLKFADAQLSKARLVQTGNSYLQKLKEVFTAEVQKRNVEVDNLSRQKQQQTQQLTTEIAGLEQQLQQLQQQLQQKRNELAGIDEKYVPLSDDIQQKIKAGQLAIEEVTNEMKTVLSIIENEIKS